MKIKQELEKWQNFMIVSLVLAVFFVLNTFHNWANNFIIKLHFCSHTYCMIYSVFWFVFAYLAWDKKKSYLKTALIILVVGIILMNMSVCVNGNISIGSFSLKSFTENKCTSGVDCPGDIVEVPIPPCRETDTGRDYITFGTVLSGANIEDICMGNVLRERYCNSETTYTSEDINCPEKYGTDWICEEGECREAEIPIPDLGTETNCGDGIDNDNDQMIDCVDTDCAFAFTDGGCGDFDYSCQHISPYPLCGGTCPIGEKCIDYSVDGSGWCECMSELETACGESYPNCGGWCAEGDICLPAEKGCICVFDNGNCYESDSDDNPLIGGYCYNFADNTFYYDECASSLVLFEQKCIYSYGCDTFSIICSNDTDYGLFGYTCFDGLNGAICGEY